MNIQPLTNKDQYENYYQSVPLTQKTFISSWNWGEFNEKMDQKVWRLGVFDATKLVGVAQAIKVKARRGTFLLVPHSPHLTNWQNWPVLLGELVSLARQEKCLFLRVLPYLPRTTQSRALFSSTGFIPSPIHTHAERTWNLDLSPTTDQLLQNMRKTTRYCINYARRQQVTISQSTDPSAIQHYLELQQQTVQRHHFTPFSKHYLTTEMTTFTKDKQAVLFLAHFQSEIIAAALVIFWQGCSYYHQGASSLKYPKLQAPYLLQWEAILESKKRGNTLHNFWGIAESADPRHPWAGVTLFKQGFGGTDYTILHSQDLPLSPLYWPIFGFETLRRLKRRL